MVWLIGALFLLAAFAIGARFLLSFAMFLFSAAAVLLGGGLVVAGALENQDGDVTLICGATLLVLGLFGIATVRRKANPSQPAANPTVTEPDWRRGTGTMLDHPDVRIFERDLARLEAAKAGEGRRGWSIRSRETRLDCAWALLRKHLGQEEAASAEQKCREFLALYPSMPPNLEAAELASHITTDVPEMTAHLLSLACVAPTSQQDTAKHEISDRLLQLAVWADRLRKAEVRRREHALRESIDRPYRRSPAAGDSLFPEAE